MEILVTIADLHFEHRSWTSELNFHEDELRVFEKRLEDVVRRHQEQEISKRVEYFQNHFTRHNEVIDILKHKITIHEQELNNYDKDHHIDVDNKSFKNHSEIRDKMETQQHLYKDLKTEFMGFLTKMA